MPRMLIVLALLAAPKGIHLSGTATRVHETTPCMGGVRITPEMIERETQVLGQAVFTFYAGNTVPTGAPVAKIKTDAKGRFSVDLAPGAYCVMEGEPAARIDAGVEPLPAAPPAAPNFDAACLRHLHDPRCAATINVAPAGSTDASFQLFSRNQCPQPWAQPCYRGPLPP